MLHLDPPNPAPLGHVSPESTYWYLQSVPELQGLISDRLEQIGQELS